MQKLREYFSTNQDRFISEWKSFLSLKSISTDPEFHEDCVACAEWVRSHLSGLGFSCELLESETKPVVYGVREGNPTKPVVLFYGHYDVQPVDPLNLWETDPFTPSLRNGRMYARGAQDNKGQVFFFFKALETLQAQGADLPTIKVLIEGEEECGSEALHAGLPGWSERLQANILMVCDTGMVAPRVPTVIMGLRGIVACEIRAFGPAMDLHSGVYGGIVLNPLQALAKILASLHNPDGSVAVPGFYDGVKEPTAEERAMIRSTPLNLDDTQALIGVSLEGGETRFSPLERRGHRPTLEINGMGGGYQGAGGKTVIPSEAMAKLSMRLVAGQDPHRVLKGVLDFIKSLAPKGIRIEIGYESVGGPALCLPSNSSVLELASKAIEKAFNRPPVYMWEGASIPIIPLLSKASGAEPLLVGFGLEEDSIHSPNESFSLEQLEDGYQYVTSFLGLL